jgi:putative membrane protein
MKKKKDYAKVMKGVLALAIIGIMFVPMLYSTVYLGAIWDAYGEIGNVPVAFVNKDEPYTKDGKEYYIGAELENKLKNNDKVAWKFVDYETAMSGLKGTEYYAVIEIPEGFSEKIANAQDGEFGNTEIIYSANKGRNFIFSQISEKIATNLKTEVSSSIQEEISKALVDSLYDVKVSIKDAGDGAEQLATGQQQLLVGSAALKTGAEKAAIGSEELGSGLAGAASASALLHDGTSKLLDGSSAMSAGLSTAAHGSGQLQQGLTTIADGESQITAGASGLVAGLNELKTSLTQKNSQIPLLVSGASDVSKNTAAIEQGAEKLNSSLNTGLNSLADGVGQAADAVSQSSAVLNSEIDSINNSDMSQEDKAKLTAAISAIDKVNGSDMGSNIETPLRGAATSAQPLVDSLKQLTQGTEKISGGVSTLATALSESQSKAAAGIDQLICGASAIQSGSSSLLEGLNTASGKTVELTDGLNQLDSASVSISDGLGTVNEGNASLTEGLNTASEKTGELTAGLQLLSSGTTSLNIGIQEATDGTVKLRDGLVSGYEVLSGNLKFSSEDMSSFIADPVSLKNASINYVKSYGQGFAPYFMSLSLWIGTMLMSLAFSIGKKLKLFKSRLMQSFAGSYAAGTALAALQALILSFVLLKGLGITPVTVSGFYAANIFVAVVFFSIMFGVSNAIGIFGAPLMFILLLLQLASSGGTFPIETAPALYRAINGFIPMTYSVNILRAIVSNANAALLGHNIIIMLMFMTAAMAGGILIRTMINRVKNRAENKNARMVRRTEAA